MVVQHRVNISRPIEDCHETLVRGPRQWFQDVGAQKSVSIEAGELVKFGGWTEVPVSWRATHIKGLFPVMVGKVELARVAPGVTRLTVCGEYDPPAGRHAEHVDYALIHMEAEATVKELAEALAKRLGS
jgi:hypothetical protein